MLSLLLAITGFVLYLLYDINSFLWQRRLPRGFFALGTVLVALATALALWRAVSAGAFAGVGDGLLLAAGVLFAGALVYCLFFALPFQSTYVTPQEGQRVCDRGVYALCRHPGVPCFFLAYLFVGLAALPSDFVLFGLVLSGLDVLYAWFQDRVTFPRSFSDYDSYRQRIPFLIPTRKSIDLAWRTRRRSAVKEDHP